MHIILLILKIIGMFLLGIIGLVLLILLLLLLSPLGYSLTGCYHSDGNKKLLGKVHYLFHALKIDLMWNGEKVKFRIKLLGFTLKKGGSDVAKSDTEASGPEPVSKEDEFFHETSLSEGPEVTVLPEGDQVEGKEHQPEMIQETEPSKEQEPEALHQEEVQPEEVCKEEVQKEKVQKVPIQPIEPSQDKIEPEEADSEADTKKKGPLDKVYEIIDKVQRAYEVISQPSMVKMRNRLLKRLIKILKHLLPRDLNIKGEFGLKDPALMGKIMEAYAFLYAFWGDHFEISTDFEREHIDVKGRIRGKLVFAYLVHQIIWMGLAVLWQKDARKFIFGKLFHK